MDIGDGITSIYLVIFALVVVPLSLYVSFRGLRAPKLSALLSIISICFVFSYSIALISDIAFYFGLTAIPILALVVWCVDGSSPILVAAALPLHMVYTIYSMFLVQTVTNGYVQFGIPSNTSWVTCLFVAIFLAIATGFFMLYADEEPQRYMFVASSSTTGIFFGIHYVGAIFSGRLVLTAADYFKIFALRPWICWPVALGLTGLAVYTQLDTIPATTAASTEEIKPLVAEA
ncbi:hypothetical protein AC1031_021647 [Aphanomyces cochlioides]|nr:hypothetical protein AC1031_021647 [Aphanomyces cochlioides]